MRVLSHMGRLYIGLAIMVFKDRPFFLIYQWHNKTGAQQSHAIRLCVQCPPLARNFCVWRSQRSRQAILVLKGSGRVEFQGSRFIMVFDRVSFST